MGLFGHTSTRCAVISERASHFSPMAPGSEVVISYNHRLQMISGMT